MGDKKTPDKGWDKGGKPGDKAPDKGFDKGGKPGDKGGKK